MGIMLPPHNPQRAHEGQSRLVWLITGASSGLGLALVQRVLVRGDYVIAMVRTRSKMSTLLPQLFEEVRADIASFSTCATTDRYMGSANGYISEEQEAIEKRIYVLEMNLTESEAIIREKVDAAVGVWGRVDVLVNNAGMAIAAITEEGGSQDMQTVFATNFFGTINVTNAVLPHMRDRRQGTIVMMGSRSAWRNEFAGVGLYAASKAALHSYTESLSAEISSFNIRTLILAPGSFVTPGIYPPLPPLPPPSSPQNTPISASAPSNSSKLEFQHTGTDPVYEKRIPAYDTVRIQMIKRMETLKNNPSVKGDPKKGMEVVVDLVRGEGRAGEILRGARHTTIDGDEKNSLVNGSGINDHVGGEKERGEEWPLWLFLGEDGQRDVRVRNERVGRCLDVWGEVGRGLEIRE